MAYTTKSAKKSLSDDKSFEDIEVFAAFIRQSLPRDSTETLRFD
jgi:hypothetical protein